MTHSDEPSMSERLAEVSRLMRAPLAQLSGHTNEEGREGLDKLGRLLSDLPKIEATTPADALALVSLAGEVFGHLVQHSSGDAVAKEATGALACVLIQLRTCLAGLADMDPTAFGLSPERGARPLH